MVAISVGSCWGRGAGRTVDAGLGVGASMLGAGGLLGRRGKGCPMQGGRRRTSAGNAAACTRERGHGFGHGLGFGFGSGSGSGDGDGDGDGYGLPAAVQPGMATRLWGGLVTLILLAAVVWPLGRDPIHGDSFPLSTYPMFAFKRPGARVAIDYVIATGPGGGRRHVPPELVANAEVMQALMTVRRAVQNRHAPTLCAEVAARVARDRRFDAMDTVAVVFGDHRAVGYLVHGVHGPEREHARCPIARSRTR